MDKNKQADAYQSAGGLTEKKRRTQTNAVDLDKKINTNVYNIYRNKQLKSFLWDLSN